MNFLFLKFKCLSYLQILDEYKYIHFLSTTKFNIFIQFRTRYLVNIFVSGLDLQPPTVVFLREQRPCCREEYFHQFWHFENDPICTQGCFLANVRIGRLHEPLYLGCQIPRHLWWRDGPQSTQSQTHDELHWAV